MHTALQLVIGLVAVYAAIEAFDRWGFEWPIVWVGLLGVLTALTALASVLP